jgi:hypothetical protein
MQSITRALVLAAGLSALFASTVPVAAQEPAKPQEAPPPAAQETPPPAAQEAAPPAVQEAPPPATQPETGTGFKDAPWRFDVNLYFWTLSVPATIENKDGSREIDVNVSFHDLLKYMNFGIMGEAEVHKGPVGLFVSPMYGDLEESTNFTGPLGNDNNATGYIKMSVIDYGISYQVAHWKLGNGADAPVLTLEPYGGYRYFYDKTTIKLYSSALNRTVKTSTTSIINTPILGARAVLDLTKRWYFTAAGDYGWNVEDVVNTWQAIGLVGYRFKMGKFPSKVFAGTRYLHLSTDDGTVKANLALKGPLVGLGMEF